MGGSKKQCGSKTKSGASKTGSLSRVAPTENTSPGEDGSSVTFTTVYTAPSQRTPGKGSQKIGPDAGKQSDDCNRPTTAAVVAEEQPAKIVVVDILSDCSTDDILLQAEKLEAHPLLLAAGTGHVDGLRKLLTASLDINMKHPKNGDTATHLAARGCHMEALKMLLPVHPNLNQLNDDGNNPFMVAVATASVDSVNFLWQYRSHFNVNQANKKGLTALHLAAEHSWESCVNMLLTGGCARNWTTLFEVAQKNTNGISGSSANFLQCVVSRNSQPFCSDGSTALAISAKKGDLKTAHRLVDSGAFITIENQEECTPICLAVQEGHRDMYNYLLDKLSPYYREVYVKRRVDFLHMLPAGEDTEEFFETVLYPVFYALACHKTTREFFTKFRILPQWMASIKRHLGNENAADSGFHYLAYCMWDEDRDCVDSSFVDAFLRCNGPDFIMHALQFYKNINSSFMVTSTVLLLLPFCETSDGKKWLEGNYHNICESLQTFQREKKEDIDFMEPRMKDSFMNLWQKFREKFHTIQAIESQRHGAELLESEEREKVKRERKREKRRQKRQLQRIKEAQMTAQYAASSDHPQPRATAAPDEARQQSPPGRNETDPGRDVTVTERSTRATPRTTASEKLTIHEETRVGFTYTPDPAVRLQPFQEVLSKKKSKEIKKLLSSEVSTQQDGSSVGRKKAQKTSQAKPKPALLKIPEKKHKASTLQASTRPEKFSTKGMVDLATTTPGDHTPNCVVQNIPAETPQKAEVTHGWTDTLPVPVDEAAPVTVRHAEQSEHLLSGQRLNRHEEACVGTVDVSTKRFVQETVCGIITAASSNLGRHKSEQEAQHQQQQQQQQKQRQRQPNLDEKHPRFRKPNPAAIIDSTQVKKSKRKTITVTLEEFLKKEPDAHTLTGKQRISDATEQQADQKPWTASAKEFPLPASSKVVSENLPRESSPPADRNRHSPSAAETPADVDCSLKPTDFLPPWVRDRLKRSGASFPRGEDNDAQTARYEGRPALDAHPPHSQQEELVLNCGDEAPPVCSLDGSTDCLLPPQEGAGDAAPAMHVGQRRTHRPPFQYTNNLNTCEKPQRNQPQTPPEHLNIPVQTSASNTFTSEIDLQIQEKSQLIDLQHFQPVTQTDEEFAVLAHDPDALFPDDPRYYKWVRKDWFGKGLLDPRDLYLDDLWMTQGPLSGVALAPSVKQQQQQQQQQPSHRRGKLLSNFPLVQSLMGAGDSYHDNSSPPSSDDASPHYWLPSDLHLEESPGVPGGSSPQEKTGEGGTSSAVGNSLDAPEFVREEHASDCAELEAKEVNAEKHSEQPHHETRKPSSPESCPVTCPVDNQPSADTPLSSHQGRISKKTCKRLLDEFPDILQRFLNIRSSATDDRQSASDGGLSRTEQHADGTSELQRPVPECKLPTATRRVLPEPEPPQDLRKSRSENVDRANTTASVTTSASTSTVPTWVPSWSTWRDLLNHMQRLPEFYKERVGRLTMPKHCSHFVIGQSSQNALLSLGVLDGQHEVAVKRIQRQELEVCKPILDNLLRKRFSHVHVIPYICYVESDLYGYIVSELSEVNLATHVQTLKAQRGSVGDQIGTHICAQIMKGLQFLHEHNTVHGRLKPQNILVDALGRIRLSDYGLPLGKIFADPISYDRGLASGRCWRATPDTTCRTASEFITGCRADIQVAGMLVYYVMTGGCHPFGSVPEEIEKNILERRHQLQLVSLETEDLVEKTLTSSDKRPSAEQVLRHPFFWEDKEKTAFLTAVSQEMGRQINGSKPPTIWMRLDTITSKAVSGWRKTVDAGVLEELEALRGEQKYMNNLPDLVLCMDNAKVCSPVLSQKVQRVLAEHSNYFLVTFPWLFMAVYRTLATIPEARTALANFFDN